eukprot:jgi/Astpho2/6490/fgenesh1_pg.00096_%23_21_t
MLSVGLPRWLTSPCTPSSCRPQSALKALSTQTLEHLQSLQTAKRISRGTDEGVQHQQEQQQEHLAGPDISRLAPHLQREWDHKANACLGSIVISPNTDRKVWWASGMCKSGQLHRWQATVQNRSNGRGCPYATGKKGLLSVHNRASVSRLSAFVHCTPCQALQKLLAALHWLEIHATYTESTHAEQLQLSPGTSCAACLPLTGPCVSAAGLSLQQLACPCNNLAHNYPRVAAEWDWEANAPRTPASAGRLKTRQPSIAAGATHLLEEWDYAANEAEGWRPDTVSLMSAKKVHWIRREECRLGMLHKWQAPPYRRIAMNQGSPFPHGKAVCACNSLAVQCPEAAKLWDNTANGDRTPENVTVGSNEPMHWVQPDGKRWQQQVIEVVNNLRRQQRVNN